MVPILFESIPGYRCLSSMEHEARIGYLCYHAARDQLTLGEKYGLLGHIAFEMFVFRLVLAENLLMKCQIK